MACKFVVFVVFATMARASLAAVDVDTAKKTSREGWFKAADIVFDAGENPTNLDSVKSQYLSVASAAGQAFVDATPGKDEETLQKEGSALYQKIVDLVLEALKIASLATPETWDTASADIDNKRKQLPLAGIVKNYWSLAQSTAPSTKAAANLDKVFDQFFAGIKSPAAVKAGKATKVDTSFKSAARDAINGFNENIYGTLKQ